VHPSPISGGGAVVTLSLTQSTAVTLELYTATGACDCTLLAVNAGKPEHISMRLDPSRLAAGTYVLLLKMEYGNATRSIVVLR
jgi:hypothetical protein